MSLNRILELCEEHMSEGDYLQASNTLREIYNNKPDQELIKRIEFESLRLGSLKRCCDSGSFCERCESLLIVAVELSRVTIYQRTWEIKKVYCKSTINTNTMIVEREHFQDILKHFIRSHMWVDVKLEGWFNRTLKFHFSDFNEFSSKTFLAVPLYEEDDPDDIYPKHYVDYLHYINYVTRQIVDYLEIQK
jgi:hypothetical protein